MKTPAPPQDVRKTSEATSATMVGYESAIPGDDLRKTMTVNTLGSVRLQHEHTNEIILVPQPSNDPNDPLNWSRPFRYYIAIVVCAAMVLCNFLAAGPTVAIVSITESFFGPPGPLFSSQISKVAFFFTTTALMQGISNLIWMPLIIKYGRRPVYLSSFTLYAATSIWSGVAQTYASEISARIIMGLASGAGECLAPLTIADIFFLHERGAVMACYTAALSCGVSFGIIIAGLITINHSWRYIYYVATALIGGLTVLVFFTMPETSYNRSAVPVPTDLHSPSKAFGKDVEIEQTSNTSQVEAGQGHIPAKRSYIQSLSLYNGKLTNESLARLFIRPVMLLVAPPILWATLVMSVTIGFLVAISSNFASAFSATYNFEAWQSGLCFISGLLGSLIGIFFGGHISDWVANIFTKRNGGIREPEFRLPAVTIGMIASPLGLLLYGFGIEDKLHWMVPTLGLGFLSFAIAQATNVTLVYIIDSYRPIAGETVVTQLAFKAAFGFLLSFYTNPWIDAAGYKNAFGAMAGISAGVLILWIPLFIWGKRIRMATMEWKLVKTVIRWDEDREVGE
ncbi:putative mfs transporter [Phaeomoniella chlamydospora]|uniref:Putative mfs transporter n=1 Tax=Phaeomoniella chlamydospora TaxID=158046 RepID=A0A0G2E285_PHACM|nr:putative mfs transporter [Phaeomoniella chlamydospora]